MQIRLNWAPAFLLFPFIVGEAWALDPSKSVLHSTEVIVNQRLSDLWQKEGYDSPIHVTIVPLSERFRRDLEASEELRAELKLVVHRLKRQVPLVLATTGSVTALEGALNHARHRSIAKNAAKVEANATSSSSEFSRILQANREAFNRVYETGKVEVSFGKVVTQESAAYGGAPIVVNREARVQHVQAALRDNIVTALLQSEPGADGDLDLAKNVLDYELNRSTATVRKFRDLIDWGTNADKKNVLKLRNPEMGTAIEVVFDSWGEVNESLERALQDETPRNRALKDYLEAATNEVLEFVPTTEKIPPITKNIRDFHTHVLNSYVVIVEGTAMKDPLFVVRPWRNARDFQRIYDLLSPTQRELVEKMYKQSPKSSELVRHFESEAAGALVRNGGMAALRRGIIGLFVGVVAGWAADKIMFPDDLDLISYDPGEIPWTEEDGKIFVSNDFIHQLRDLADLKCINDSPCELAFDVGSEVANYVEKVYASNGQTSLTVK